MGYHRYSLATQELHEARVAENGADAMPTGTATKRKPQRVKLTLERINRFACPEGIKQSFLWDEDAPRLAVRATAGSKSFVFEGKLDRRTIRRTIGSVQVWTIEAARKEARELQALLDKGTDPRELDRREAEAKAAAETAKKTAAAEAERKARFTLIALCRRAAQLPFRCLQRREARALRFRPARRPDPVCNRAQPLRRNPGDPGPARTAHP